MKNKYTFLTFVYMLCILFQVKSNNVQVTNVSILNQNTTAKTTQIKFDLSWENSWRTNSAENNWDAVWIFVKYRVKGQTLWNHATLDTIGHVAGTGSKIDSVGDGKGVFMKAANVMALQNVNYTANRLRWRYGVDGVLDNDSVDICVYAIEMVYVPQNSFYLGDANSISDGNFKQAGNSFNLPFQVTSENAITLSPSTGGTLGTNSFGYNMDDFYSSTQALPSNFPKGYAGFYCMKYEITQGQYVEFLNKINSIQASNRFPNSNGTSRHTITGTWPAFSATAPYRGCNFLSNLDVAAYSDWSGLRLMTELEYEKACRGPNTAVVGEFAWGSTNIFGVTGFVNDGTTSETASNAGANCNYNNAFGPMRAGFSTGTSPGTRESTGATYYGIKDMSGSNMEIIINIGTTTGRIFTATNGDGYLDAAGNANATNWPTGTAGYGRKGGAWNVPLSTKSYCTVSNRYYALYTTTSRDAATGGRCVRTY